MKAWVVTHYLEKNLRENYAYEKAKEEGRKNVEKPDPFPKPNWAKQSRFFGDQ